MSEQTPFLAYDAAMAALIQTPGSVVHQHRAVLALARAGSLDFAWAEYRRYKLDALTDHASPKMLEDIMGLGARLLKDLSLASSGAEATHYARLSAEKYEATFKKTGGYYSGINAATMSLIGGMPDAQVHARARDILEQLPSPQSANKETLYFIEATRAEAYLVLQQPRKAGQILKRAVQHDPQNFAAHASTLRQFKMILSARGDDAAWLSKLQPPKPAHFAGHLFKLEEDVAPGILNLASYEALKLKLSDSIQQRDIGFGYGALAAGSDILCAEAILEEGGALNITLPVSPDIFIKHSVAPYGEHWVDRFTHCWEAASVRDIVTQNPIWPQYETDRFSGNVAMGKAILQANHLSVDPLQLLIWDERQGDRGTARNASDWMQCRRTQIVLPYPGPRERESSNPPLSKEICIRAIVRDTGAKETLQFPAISEAVSHAFETQSRTDHRSQIGLDINIGRAGHNSDETARQLAHHAVPGSVLASEAVVSVLLLQGALGISMDYLGRLNGDPAQARMFSLKRKG